MIFYKAKKKENEDELHHEYGVLRNFVYILRAYKRYRPSMISWLIIAGIAGASMYYVWQIIAKLVIDLIEQQAALPDKDISPLLVLVICCAGVEFVMLALNTTANKHMELGFTYTPLMLVQERIRKTLSMEYEQLESPEMLDRLHKAKRATGWSYHGVEGFMRDMLSVAVQFSAIIAAVGIISTMNPLLVVIILVLSLVEFEIFDYFRIKDKEVMWDAMAGNWRKLDYMTTVATDFSYAKDIRLYGMKRWLHGKQVEVDAEELRHWVASRNYWAANSRWSALVTIVRNVVIYGWIICDMLYGGLSIGDFTLYIGSATTLSNNIRQFLQAIGGMRERSAQVDDFRTFMDIPFADEGKKHTPVPKAEGYTFTFENVSFKYKGQDTYALKNLNLTLKAGQRLAVVGLNGAGKTTFIKLLLRLYDVTEGRILCNGIDIREFDRGEYFRLFAPAFQEVEVFAFPLSENISMKPTEETDKALAEKYLRAAGMGDKLDKLPKGMDTELLKVLYDDGVDLSGGEKQKLALARALYKDAPVVVLDEPTAALDALAEYRLYQSFNGMIGSKSAVYISHRLSSTRFCDSIAMFVAGEMVESGTHEELLAKDGAYAEMFRVQAQYYIEDGIQPDVIPEGGAVHE